MQHSRKRFESIRPHGLRHQFQMTEVTHYLEATLTQLIQHVNLTILHTQLTRSPQQFQYRLIMTTLTQMDINSRSTFGENLRVHVLMDSYTNSNGAPLALMAWITLLHGSISISQVMITSHQSLGTNSIRRQLQAVGLLHSIRDWFDMDADLAHII